MPTTTSAAAAAAHLRSIYRRFLRLGCKAVRFQPLACKAVKSRLRKAFANGSPHELPNHTILANTEAFLDSATQYRGIEHRILHNLVFADWNLYHHKKRYVPPKANRRQDVWKASYDNRYKKFDEVLQLLNRSHQIYLV